MIKYLTVKYVNWKISVVAVAQLDRAFGFGCSNLNHDRPKTLKEVVTGPTAKRSALNVSVTGSEMTIINGCPV